MTSTNGQKSLILRPQSPPEHDEPLVLSEVVEPGIGVVTLNRPDRLNAMSEALVSVLIDTIAAIAADPSVRVVILTGKGRAFSAGLDLGGYGIVGDARAGPVQQTFKVQKHIASLIDAIRSMPQPVIAAVDGAAAGGGMSLALCSDIRLASQRARFNAAFVRIGLSACDIGTSWLLPKLVGVGRAHELMLTGRFVDADEAAAIGLVIEVLEPEGLIERAIEIARSIAAHSPMGIRMTKEVMWTALEIPGQRAAIDLENRTQVMLTQTSDHLEAIYAFRDRRTPEFRDH